MHNRAVRVCVCLLCARVRVCVQLMNMLPGNLGSLMGNDAEGAARIKKFMVMMDSMTSDELDGKKKIEGSRLLRIARGSGSSPIEVDMLLKAHKQFEKMFSKMGKSGLMKGSDAHMMQQMARNPQAMMQQLQRSMDPRMLAQVGGAGTFADLQSQPRRFAFFVCVCVSLCGFAAELVSYHRAASCCEALTWRGGLFAPRLVCPRACAQFHPEMLAWCLRRRHDGDDEANGQDGRPAADDEADGHGWEMRPTPPRERCPHPRLLRVGTCICHFVFCSCSAFVREVDT